MTLRVVYFLIWKGINCLRVLSSKEFAFFSNSWNERVPNAGKDRKTEEIILERRIYSLKGCRIIVLAREEIPHC